MTPREKKERTKAYNAARALKRRAFLQRVEEVAERGASPRPRGGIVTPARGRSAVEVYQTLVEIAERRIQGVA